MKINIRPVMRIGEVQKAFNKLFPYLKLEFYRRSADIKLGKMMGESMRIADGQSAITDSSLEVMPEMTVRTLERLFADQFTLTAQVFRKSGNTWLQTTMTDDWTLQHQNEHGKEISEGKKVNSDVDPVDYDLDRDASH